MASQIAVIGIGVAIIFVLGLPFVVQGRDRKRVLLAPAFGSAALAVGATVLYGLNASVWAIRVLALCTCLVVLIMLGRRVRDLARTLCWNSLCRYSALVLCALALLPLLLGGSQFTVFQGNQGDHFSYASSSIVYSQQPFAQVARASLDDVLRNPLLAFAQGNLAARPAVMIQFAVVGGMVPGALHMGGYAFLTVHLLAATLAFLYLLHVVFGTESKRQRILVVAASIAFAFGFWGQYIVDIDAWSQLSSAPLLIALAALVIEEISLRTAPSIDEARSAKRLFKQAAVLAVLVAGALYLYPEGTVFMVALFGLMLTVVVARSRQVVPAVGVTLIAVILGVATCALFWKGTLGFFVDQAAFAGREPVDWWKFFQGYLFGSDAVLRNSLVRSLSAALEAKAGGGGGFLLIVPSDPWAIMAATAGVLGVYFLTPQNVAALSVTDAAKLFVLLFVAVVGAIGVLLACSRGSDRYRLLVGLTLGGLVATALLVVTGKNWAGGKALSFVAPFLCASLVGPLIMAKVPARSPASWGAGAWLLTQFGFIALSIVGFLGGQGVRLPPPYPGIQFEPLKSDIRWDISQQLHNVTGCREVEVVASDPYFRHFALMALKERNTTFWHAAPVNTSFGSGPDLGPMPASAAEPDCHLVQRGSDLTFDIVNRFGSPGMPMNIEGIGAWEGWGRRGLHADATVTLALDARLLAQRPTGFINFNLKPLDPSDPSSYRIQMRWGKDRTAEVAVDSPGWISLPFSPCDWRGTGYSVQAVRIRSSDASGVPKASTAKPGVGLTGIGFVAFSLTETAAGRVVAALDPAAATCLDSGRN